MNILLGKAICREVSGVARDTILPLRFIVILPVLLLIFVLHSLPQGVQAGNPAELQKRPKIGLVLSGGGARGAAHIGVIKVLEELKIPIDCIAGTSMGSIVGGLYASGMTIGEIETVLTSIDWSDAFKDLIPREDRSFRRKTDDETYLLKQKAGLGDDLKFKLPTGFIQGQKIDLIFKRLTIPVSDIRTFDDFIIPYRAIATDIVTGEAVILDSGDLAMTMRASMSVPAVFSAIEIDSRLLVDGGVSNNLPVDVVREMGAEIVIAVDISTPLLKREELKSAVAITEQLTGILTRRNTEAQIASLSDNDILIVPDLGEITSGSFARADEAVPIGYAAAEAKKKELLRFSLPEVAYANFLAGRTIDKTKRTTTTPVVDFIRLDNQSRLSDEMLLARLQNLEGQPLDVAKLENAIGKIYGLELFENIRYEVVEEEGQTGIILQVKERSWGPNYLQLGIAMSGDQDGDSTYNIALAYTRTAINRLAGEWRTVVQIGESPLIFSEIYQPLDVNSRYFIHPKILIGRNNVNFYSREGEKLAEYRVSQYGIDFAAGRDFGTWGESRLGIRRMSGDAAVKVGRAGLPDYDFDRGEFYLRLATDKLDDRRFPRKGVFGFMEYVASREGLGADSSFDQLLLDITGAKSWGRHTVQVGGRYFSTINDNAPIQNRFELGGLFNLSGFKEDQLSGQQLGLLRVGYMRRIGDFNLMPMYLGGTLEGGNTWEDRDAMDLDDLILGASIYLGLDTFLGPIYFAYGQAEHSNNSFYFYLGKIF
jgi:NTE family protein